MWLSHEARHSPSYRLAKPFCRSVPIVVTMSAQGLQIQWIVVCVVLVAMVDRQSLCVAARFACTLPMLARPPVIAFWS